MFPVEWRQAEHYTRVRARTQTHMNCEGTKTEVPCCDLALAL